MSPSLLHTIHSIFHIWGLKNINRLWFLRYCFSSYCNLLNFSREKTCIFIARYLVTESDNQLFKCTIGKNGRFASGIVATKSPKCQKTTVKTLPLGRKVVFKKWHFSKNHSLFYCIWAWSGRGQDGL